MSIGSSSRSVSLLWLAAASVLLGVTLGLVASPAANLVVSVLAFPFVLMVGLRYPEVGLAAFLYAGAFKTVVPIPVDLTVLLGALLGVVVVRALITRGLPRIPVTGWLFFAVLGLVIVGLAGGVSGAYGVEKALRFGILGSAAFLGGAVLVRDEDALARFAMTTILIGVIMGASAVAAGGNPLLYGRFTALGSNTIALGRASAVALVGAVAYLFRKRSSWWWVAPAIVVSALALAGSGSRGPALAAILALALLFADHMRSQGARRKIPVAVVGGAAASVFMLRGVVPEASVSRVAQVFGGTPGASVIARTELYDHAIALAVSSPLTGVGTGGFATTATHPYPHNVLLELAAENGLIAAMLMAALLVIGVVSSFRAVRANPSFGNDFVFLALVMTAVNAMVSGDLNDNRLMYALLAIAIMSTTRASGEDTRTHSRGQGFE